MSRHLRFLFSSPLVDNLSLVQNDDFLLFAAILYDGVWKLRNKIQFEGLSLDFDDLFPKILTLMTEHKMPRSSTGSTQVFVALAQLWSLP